MNGESQRGRARRGARWLELGLLVVAGLLLFAAGNVIQASFVRLALQPYLIPSSAMEPTLHCPRPATGCEADSADRVFVPRVHPFWTPRRRDIVVFRTPESARSKCGTGGRFIKRIVGLPNERIQVRLHRGVTYVHVDGKRLEEPYLENDRRDLGPAKTYRVPEGHYFVMGDNRPQSCDSRAFGSVPRGNLIGPVVAVYWPLDRIGLR